MTDDPIVWMNQDGQPLVLPDNTAGFRVRRQAVTARGGRGELLYGEDGLPLFVPSDCAMWEFHELVDHECGRYRFEAVDHRRHGVDELDTAIVLIGGRGRAKRRDRDEGGGVMAMIEPILRSQTDQLKHLTEQCANMMKAAATVLSAADGAAMPQREPRNLPAVPAPPVAESDSDESAPANANEVTHVVVKAINDTMPLVHHGIHRMMGLTPEQSVALLQASGAAPALAPDASSSTPAAPSSAPATPPRNTNTAPAPRAPTSTEFMARLIEVQALLTDDEQRITKKVIESMAPAELVRWQTTLWPLTPQQAAERIREQIRQQGRVAS